MAAVAVILLASLPAFTATNSSIHRRGLQTIQGLLPPPQRGPTCAVSIPSSHVYGSIVQAKLSSECPSHSNGCSGPSDGLANMELLTPCCHAHDWCYTCGYMRGLSGIEGRRVCDRQMQGNMIAVCKAAFPEGSSQRDSCLSDAEAMFGAVYTVQESIGGQLDNSYSCPGQAARLAAVGFCFNPIYQASTGVVATLSPGNGGPWGAWAELAKCPQGSWAVSLSTRVQPYQGFFGDDSGLNAVRMQCSSSSSSAANVQQQQGVIESNPGNRGIWSGFASCPAGQYIIGLQQQVEPKQGYAQDDTAANGLKALCSDDKTLDNNNSLGFGAWSEMVKCPAGSAVCGFRIKVEQGGAIDNTGMNDIQAECCKL